MRKSSSRSMREYQPPAYRGKEDRKRHTLPHYLPHALAALILIALVLLAVASHLGNDMVYSQKGGTMARGLDSDPAPAEELLLGLDVVEEEGVPPVTTSDAAYLRAVSISIDDLIAGNAARILEEQQGNALVVEMKDVDGTLYWNSRTGLVPQEADPAAPEGEDEDEEDEAENDGELYSAAVVISPLSSQVETALAQCQEEGIYLIARIHCLRDNNIGRDRDYNLKTPGTDGDTPIELTYRDGNGDRWIDPASSNMQVFYSDLAKELVELGFQELLFSDLHYPPELEGSTASRPEYINAFAGAVADAARSAQSPYDVVRLGIESDADLLNEGKNAAFGHNLSALKEHFDRIWCAGATEATVSQCSEEELSSGLLVLEQNAFEHNLFTSAQAILTK